MRIIDADALLNEIREYKVMQQSENTDYRTGYISAMSTVEGMIADELIMPTIDAIPVEWLIDRANDPERAPLYRRYAKMLYEEWQEEQEAR